MLSHILYRLAHSLQLFHLCPSHSFFPTSFFLPCYLIQHTHTHTHRYNIEVEHTFEEPPEAVEGDEEGQDENEGAEYLSFKGRRSRFVVLCLMNSLVRIYMRVCGCRCIYIYCLGVHCAIYDN